MEQALSLWWLTQTAIVCYDRDECWVHPESGETSGPTDATIVATHMMLEATARGLGSAWLSYFDKEKARELLHLPENWEIYSMLYLGYPAVGEGPAHIFTMTRGSSRTTRSVSVAAIL